MKKHFLFLLFSLVIASILCMSAGISQSVAQDKNHGVGPIKSVKLDPTFDKKMVAEGKGIFNDKCVLCHELDQLKIGPPLRNIAKDRAPEYIMNLLLNTAGMQKDDPSVRALIKKYNNIVMISPELNEAKARSVLEYLRSVVK